MGYRFTVLTSSLLALVLVGCANTTAADTSASAPAANSAPVDNTSKDTIAVLPEPTTSEPDPGGWELANSLPEWDVHDRFTDNDPETVLTRIAGERGWTQYEEPDEGGSLTFLTDTDAAINAVWVDNDPGRNVTDLKADPHIPFYHGASSDDLLTLSSGYTDKGYHFPPQAGSWLAWKTKFNLTPGRIRSFRYRIDHGTAPITQVAAHYDGQGLIARYTPDPTQNFVSVPFTAGTPDDHWTLYNEQLEVLAEHLTWTDVLDWPTPDTWPARTFRDTPLNPATRPEVAPDGGAIFLPGDLNGIRLINSSDAPTYITMIEFGFHWADRGRDYLQIRLFTQDPHQKPENNS